MLLYKTLIDERQVEIPLTTLFAAAEMHSKLKVKNKISGCQSLLSLSHSFFTYIISAMHKSKFNQNGLFKLALTSPVLEHLLMGHT